MLCRPAVATIRRGIEDNLRHRHSAAFDHSAFSHGKYARRQANSRSKQHGRAEAWNALATFFCPCAAVSPTWLGVRLTRANRTQSTETLVKLGIACARMADWLNRRDQSRDR